MNKTNCVILAAGDGKRMFARSSKVLCEVAYKPMVNWVVDTARAAGVESICCVVSNPDVEKAVGGCSIAWQTERLGTGHAVKSAMDFLENHRGEDTLILFGDAPFMDSETVLGSYELHKASGAAQTVISAEIDDPTGYGRIVRRHGKMVEIVEELDCDDATRKIREINSGAAWFRTDELIDALGKITNNNQKGEYYLTDTIGIFFSEGKPVECFTASTPDVTLGANNPLHLLNLNDMASERAIRYHLSRGVHFVNRDGVVISPDVTIEPGATILPGTVLYGNTHVGRGSVIGPNSLLCNVTVGEDTEFNASQGFDSTIGSGAKIGPFVQIRPGSHIGDKVKIGDFVEIKNSTIGEGTSLAHLTYIGDSDVGCYCNFGCGVVVVNYDGEEKNRCVVKDYAFIGCNTNLVSPVVVGEGAYTAAGSTITKDIPDGALAIERSALTIKDGWATRKLKKYIEKKEKLRLGR